VSLIRHIRVRGRVQGVGFRAFVEHQALKLGVGGWVRNRLDGTVEAMVQGTQEAVEAMIAVARQGPRAAVVTEVRVGDGEGEFSEFWARPTE